MLKRSIGIGCGIVATLCVAQIVSSSINIHNRVQVVGAEEVCSTSEECDDQINAARNRISSARSEREEVENDLAEVEDDLTAVLARIDATESSIAELETQIEEINMSINQNKQELAQLDDDVVDLQELIGYRLRLAQRMNNGNEILEFLTESETIVDFIRRVRIINHLSKTDAELMEELNTLIERQQTILRTLQEEQNTVTAKNQQLEAEKVTLTADQKELENRTKNLTEQIIANENMIIDEEEALRIAEAQRDVLARLEIPQVTTDDNSNEDVSSENESKNNQGTSDDESNNSGNTDVSNNGNSSSANGSGNDNSGSGNDSNGSTSGGGNDASGNTNGGGNNTVPVSSKFIRPMSSGVVTCEWMCYTNHTGIDISHGSAVPILAAAGGLVTTSGWHSAYGNWVVIEHDINGERYATVYAHMLNTPMVSVGSTVTQGQQLGNMGNTGNSYGAHLHFEIHPGGWGWNNAVNPRNYLSFPPAGTWF